MNTEQTIVIHHPVIVLVGPTAVGKTDLSLEMAEKFHCEIISMDSMQVYRYMDIGTAKVSKDEQKRVQHHLIDIRNPDEQYDASLFVKNAISAINKIIAKGKTPLITGGTGMYLNSLVHGLFQEIEVTANARERIEFFFRQKGREAAYNKLQKVDPDTAARIHINDTQRLVRGLEIYEATGKPWSKHLLEQKKVGKTVQFDNIIVTGIRCDREILSKRITMRTHKMLKEGFIEEVESLLSKGYEPNLTSMQSIGYKQVVQLIQNGITLEQAIDDIILATKKYAKRQFTWFKKNKDLVWFEKGDEYSLMNTVKNKMNNTLHSTSPSR